MKKKENTKSRATDLLILLFCFAGAFISGLAFWQEYNRTQVKLNEDPVGTVVFKNRTAQRKFDDRLIWDRLRQESPVYNGDTIRTAELSEAIITFRDEVTSVGLSENTLIQIFYDDLGVRIDFSGGMLEVNSGSRNVFISNGASTIEVEENSQASLNKSDDGFGLSVFNGQAQFDGQRIESGNMLILQSNGLPSTNPAIAVTSMGSFAQIFGVVEGVTSVGFSWNSSNFDPGTHVIIEIAEDRNFNRIIQTRDVTDGSTSISIPLPSGAYWWQAYPAQEGSSRPVSPMYPSGRFEILPAEVVAAVTPSRAAELTFSGEVQVPFSWSAVEGAASYLLEVSANSNMGNPVINRELKGTTVTETGLESGRWYWRVTPVFLKHVKATAVPSEIAEFSVAKGSSVPAAPVLNVPVQNGIISLTNPRLLWSYDANVSSWTVEIANNPQMSNPLVRQELSSNFYSVPASLLQNGGTYYWRVTASNGGEGSASQISSFTAETNVWEQRTIFPPDNYSFAAGDFGGLRFSYSSNVPFRNYLQISSQSDFSTLTVNEPVENAQGSLVITSLEPGIWYWRITADSDSGPVSSAPRRINIVSSSEEPFITSPSTVSQGDPLTLNWNALYFDSYQVSVYDGNTRLPVDQQIIESNSATIPTSSLAPGSYFVSIQGFNPESARSGRITGVPAETSFTVIPVEPSSEVAFELPPQEIPEIVSPPPVVIPPPSVPLDQTPITLELTRVSGTGTVTKNYPPEGYVTSWNQLSGVEEINFVWEGRAPEYRFALYRADGEAIIPPSWSVKTTTSSYVFSNPGRLSAGDYIWQVFESDRRGKWSEYPSTANRFTITDGPPLIRTIPTNDPGALYGSR
jgi:hypothetical protein